MTIPLIAVAALADNHVIGNDNRLIWRLKTDLKRFRRLTMGRPLIMGRKTFQSIGKALPGRHTVVLTRDLHFGAEGVTVTHTLEAALAAGQDLAQRHGADAVVIGGGADLYDQTLPMCDRLHLTYVHAQPAGDALFPAFARGEWLETSREEHSRGPDDEHPFTFLDLKRRI
ncbi:MAG: dihydrofolate reductase [Hyphomicrobiales bacterium]|jgi:dihydrofolate reductase|nr:dihydrofolate reductase [Hyphomicrobiales bacterium]